MKKTLITLAALAMASVAQAGVLASPEDGGNLTLQDWDVAAGESYNQVFGGTETDKSFTLTFAIDWNAAVEYVPTVENKTLVQVGTTPSEWFKSAVDLAINGTDITASVRVDYNNSWTTLGSITFDKENYMRADGVLTLSYSFDATKTFTLYAMKNDANATITSQSFTNPNETWSIGSDNANNPLYYGKVYIGTGLNGEVVDAMLGFNKVLNEDEIRAASKYIPEPTTATLSLLALAGLAARRRRK